MYTPTDEEIDATPYDYPLHWLQRFMDVQREFTSHHREDVVYVAKWNTGNLTLDRRSRQRHLQRGQQAYARAVFLTDPVEDKSDRLCSYYQKLHKCLMFEPVGPALRDSKLQKKYMWDERTFQHGYIEALAVGPFYSIALKYSGRGVELVAVAAI